MPDPLVKKMGGQSGGIRECGEECEGGEQCCSLTWSPLPSPSSALAGKLMHIHSDRNNNKNENW